MTLSAQKNRLSPPSLRGALIKIHKDLLKIHDTIGKYAEYSPDHLTILEVMVLVLEDRRFFSHIGVDAPSMAREIFRALTFQRHGGASTIDMQLVRTATGYRARTLSRKIYEIFLAVIIQYRYRKIDILRSYLSCAFFGSQLHGASRAAYDVWNCTPDQLNIDQAAFIAAMLVYPKPKSGDLAWKTRVQRRANYGVAIHRANKKRFEKLPG